MDTMFMSSGNSKTSDPHRLLLNLFDKINLKRSDKYVALSNLSIHYTWKNIKKSSKNSKLKVLALTWNEEFELPDGSYFVSDIHYYFAYILKKHGEKIDNSSIRIYVSKIENRITLKIKTRYFLELLIPEKMKFLGNTKSKELRMKSQDENGENVPHLEIIEVVLFHCNFVNNDYQQDSRVLYTFTHNKLFGQLLDISPKNFIFNSEFSYIEVWFTDQNPKPLDHTKQSATDEIKTVSKRAIQKTAEGTGDLIGNKIAERITKVSKISPQNNSETVTNKHDKEIPEEGYISPEDIQKIIDDLGLI